MLLLLKRFLDSLYLVFSTRLLSSSQLQSLFQSNSVFSSFLGNLVLLPCVDDFQYLCFSSWVQLSSRHCFLRESRPAVGCALLPAVGCALLPLGSVLVDLPLVVVHVLRLCAPLRQSGVASFVHFSSSLAVMLSLFSVFWRRFLQLYLVLVHCSEVRLMHLRCHYSACATS